MSVERIQQHIRDSAALVHEALDALSLPIAAAVDAMFMALANGNKIVACGDGPSAAAAERLAAALIGGFERERPGLPGLALHTDASRAGAAGDAGQIFAQQVRALGQTGDVLLVLDPLGESPRVLAAVEEAREREMIVVALTGNGGGHLGASLADTDIQICVPSERAARIQEVHLLTIHCLCDGIDAMLLGED
ncbi:MULTISPECIES: SIS domain-containing protein [Burkholderia]|uniref:Phosphoheptose isomerase n=1 Tax=Burkholderia mayonis TaxID=1385591 RepID=A0A1B4FAC0_9BURK|nr:MULTISPECIES: SIS domain-containing protein [Burkholderia]AOJ00604.1 phosphoheptose isomerase [Burkholderia mayonis]AOJ08493.1 phosphoheptose isomerase [Burkholderia mayonis]KVE34825.1 phosphoheptose isomerase [Burkholderia sp. BDU5]KVE45248.1 phosphoheptose isomerase [Burkholderia mayonis]KVE52823.1 phosphoheptose isomerase [Burkholderia mayonis]